MPRERTRGPRTPELGALGQAIEPCAREAKLSQHGLAERTGLYPTAISSLERGQSNPTYLTLIDLAAGLGTSVSTLTATAERIRTQLRTGGTDA